ncbi:MAG: STAS/SEC14 domain-containing protein [Piscirickettsiaceae bacterium]|nr:STAS/SEC14 domain-containing protein [Piscirickettsiaceae bacterium]
MAIRLNYEEGGLIVFYISGVLSKQEFDLCMSEAAPLIEKKEARILGIVTDFNGWENDKDWGDLSLQERLDPHIKKMAIVCELEWRDLTAMFTLKGMRDFPIEHFNPENEDFARAWLLAD